MISITYFISVPTYVILSEKQAVYAKIQDIEETQPAIVFGAGLKNNFTEPDDVLQDRLDTTVELYEAGKITKILVSGDNSREEYNEPKVMKEYLVDKGLPEDIIFTDFAGRRSYDTCIRAKNVWRINEALLITSGYHLYRSIYTCSYLGIESTCISGSKREYVNELQYKFREIFAIHKMFIDLYVWPPLYIGGEQEEGFSEN